jgi:hypothetical protein
MVMLVQVATTLQLIAFITVLVWDSTALLNLFTVFSPGDYYTGYFPFLSMLSLREAA